MVKYVVIGTAGHVDHGKTTLIRALTGTDTDRLPEEKRRGLTIETGFAHLSLPGVEAAIVDVPGHERFIRNMLVGAGQVDVALLVVAADEGVKPQTVEHAEILRLLGVQRGVVALTRRDLAAPEALARTREQLRRLFAGGFLENAPVLEVCALTGAGLPELCAALEHEALLALQREKNAPVHMPIDRVFTVPGFGTVVTGALMQGSLRVGETVFLRPGGKAARVRGIQRYGKDVDAVCAGQRAAVNLAGVETAEIHRGCALDGEKARDEAKILCVKLNTLPHEKCAIRNGMRLHLHADAGETLCRVYLEHAAALAPGQNAVAQLVPEDALGVIAGSRFIVRSYSPVETVGGGTVLATAARRYRPQEAPHWALLRALDGGTPQQRVLALCAAACAVPWQGGAHVRLRLSQGAWEAAVTALESSGQLARAGALLMDARRFHALCAELRAVLSAFHAGRPLEAGMPLGALCAALSVKLPQGSMEQLLTTGADALGVRVFGGLAALPEFCPETTGAARALSAQLLGLLEQRGFLPLSEAEAALLCGQPPRACRNAFEALGGAVRCLGGMGWLLQERYRQAEDALSLALAEAPFTLARYRDILGASRKPCQLLLEHFDAAGMTRRTGDLRVCGEKQHGSR